MDARRVDRAGLLGHVALAGQRQHQVLERRIQRRVAQHRAHRVDEGRIELDRRVAAGRRQQAPERQALAGFPAVERIGVVLQQHQQFGVGQPVGQGSPAPRSRAAARARVRRRGRRRCRSCAPPPAPARVRWHRVAASSSSCTGRACARRGRRGRSRAGITHGLVRACGRRSRRGACSSAQRVGAGGRVVAAAGADPWGPGLGEYQRLNCGRVRASSLPRVGVGDRLGEVVAGHGLAVEAFEVQRHPMRRSPARPTRVCIMRTTSAPFS